MAGYCINFHLICFGARLKQFFTDIPWKNLRVQNFSIFSVLVGRICCSNFQRVPFGNSTWILSKRCILSKLYWSFINNFILKSGQSNLYCRVEKLFYSLPNKKEKEERDWWVLSPISLSVYCRTIEYEEYDPNRNAYIWFIR